MKKFNNKENIQHETKDGKIIWESRSVAVAATIIIEVDGDRWVLAGKRGYNAADYQGYWNLICGYLDWNETLEEATKREVWEESGLDLDILSDFDFDSFDLHKPWRVNSDPSANKQNVTCHFGCIVKLDHFPKLSTKYNEVDGETEEVKWIPIDEINDYNWAFSHDKIIELYVNNVFPF